LWSVLKNDKIVQGDRLDNVEAVEEGKLLKIGAAPKFELTNQDNVKKLQTKRIRVVYVLILSLLVLPFVQ
jgi:protein SCO1/2